MSPLIPGEIGFTPRKGPVRGGGGEVVNPDETVASPVFGAARLNITDLFERTGVQVPGSLTDTGSKLWARVLGSPAALATNTLPLTRSAGGVVFPRLDGVNQVNQAPDSTYATAVVDHPESRDVRIAMRYDPRVPDGVYSHQDGLVFRYVDRSNFWLVTRAPSQTAVNLRNWELRYYQGGSFFFGGLFAPAVAPEHTVEVVLDEEDRITLFVNGVNRGTVQNGTHASATRAGVQANLPYTDLPQIKAFSITQRSRRYGELVLEDGPWGFWRFTETSGSFADSSIATDDVITNRRPLSVFVSPPAYDQPGPKGRALVWGNTSGYLGTTVTLASSPITVEAWVWITNTPAVQTSIVSMADSIGGGTFDKTLYVRTDGRIGFYWYGDFAPQFLSTPSVVSQGAWHHVAATVGPSGTRLYLDGDLVAFNPISNSFNGNLRVFVRGGTNVYGGESSLRIAEPAVYLRDIGATRIFKHHAALAG